RPRALLGPREHAVRAGGGLPRVPGRGCHSAGGAGDLQRDAPRLAHRRSGGARAAVRAARLRHRAAPPRTAPPGRKDRGLTTRRPRAPLLLPRIRSGTSALPAAIARLRPASRAPPTCKLTMAPINNAPSSGMCLYLL